MKKREPLKPEECLKKLDCLYQEAIETSPNHVSEEIVFGAEFNEYTQFLLKLCKEKNAVELLSYIIPKLQIGLAPEMQKEILLLKKNKKLIKILIASPITKEECGFDEQAHELLFTHRHAKDLLQCYLAKGFGLNSTVQKRLLEYPQDIRNQLVTLYITNMQCPKPWTGDLLCEKIQMFIFSLPNGKKLFKSYLKKLKQWQEDDTFFFSKEESKKYYTISPQIRWLAKRKNWL